MPPARPFSPANSRMPSIESKVNEMKAARSARNFKQSDAIRAELMQAGILVEITKDGIRWRRK